MIIIKPDNSNYKSCSACALHRKPNADSTRVFSVSLQTSKHSNSLVISLCEDCLKGFSDSAGKALQNEA
jgi:hypothetical protein